MTYLVYLFCQVWLWFSLFFNHACAKETPSPFRIFF